MTDLLKRLSPSTLVTLLTTVDELSAKCLRRELDLSAWLESVPAGATPRRVAAMEKAYEAASDEVEALGDLRSDIHDALYSRSGEGKS